MKTDSKFLFSALAALCVSGGAFAAGRTIPSKEALFPLSDLRLTGGVLGAQQELNRQYLLQLEPDRLLSKFRKEAGLEAKAPPYRGWESEGFELPGHILGFYLSGASMTVQATGDAELKKRLLYIVSELAAIQKANGSGFALAIKDGKKIFDEIHAGKIKIRGLPWNGNSINGHFEPTYTLNKILLGLYQVILATDSDEAKKVFFDLSDWFGTYIVDALDDRQLQELLQCEHGSMPESYVNAYELTGKEKYRTWAKRLCHRRMLDPLADGKGDFLTRFHANSNIPKYTGFEYVYRITGDARLHRSCVTEWDDVVGRRSWVVGGNSAGEHFFDPNEFRKVLGHTGPESCNSINMLRQTEILFETEPSAKKMDFYERCLFNHVLSTRDPERGMAVYFTPMFPGGYRVYSDPFDSMWCCTGTGIEAPGKYAQMIYTHDAANTALSVQLFAPSTVAWREQGVTVRQVTKFPYEEKTRLVIMAEKPTAFALRVRTPSWVKPGALGVSVNGKAIPRVPVKDGYVELARTWQTGDAVEVTFPMTLGVEPLPGDRTDDDGYVAFTYGPVVLAGELGRSGGLTKESFWTFHDHMGRNRQPEETFPAIDAPSDADLTKLLERIPGEPLAFRTKGLQPNDVTLRPFADVHFQRYAVYWRRKVTEKNTVDKVEPGFQPSEAAHDFKGEETSSGDHGVTKYRHAKGERGWFSYTLKVDPKRANDLVCTWWGEDNGRTFDILVDGKPLVEVTLAGKKGQPFFKKTYPIPEKMTKGKASVTVTFHGKKGTWVTGGLFGVATLRR